MSDGHKKFVSPFALENRSQPQPQASSSKSKPGGGTKRKLEAPPPPPAPLSFSSHAGPSRPKKAGLAPGIRTYNTPTVKRNVFYGVAQAAEEAGQAAVDTVDEYWMVQWRKPQFKKHKTWDGDAILIIREPKCFLKDTDGKDIAQGKWTAGSVKSGDELRVGGKEIEIDCPIEPKDYLSGACFGGNLVPSAARPAFSPFAAVAPRVPKNTFKPMIPSKPVLYAPHPPEIQFRPPPQPYHQQPEQNVELRVKAEPISPSFQRTVKEEPSEYEDAFGSSAVLKRFKSLAPTYLTDKATEESPLKKVNSGPKTLPRFDPKREGAVVMKRPSRDHQAKFNPKGYDVVDVVIDPVLSDKMRPHQKEGVKFMYECVMALRKVEGTGAILADEMGLGKTLQTIALIWTLLKQSPYVGPHHGSVIGKALIVCPVSLTKNWKKEFNKWLGRDTIGIMVGDGDKAQIKQFATSRRHQVLIIGYEKLRSVIGDLKGCQPQIGLIICDEGHRLKSKDAKTSKMFDALSTKKRIILSGTPLQNDLGEFWAMVNFINPGILDAYATFTKIYERPIVRSRDPHCSKQELELGQARGAKLSEIGTQFILRRTADILNKFLPPKHEYVVFVAPSKLQLDIFEKLLHPSTLGILTPQSLMMIDLCRKICNSPILARKDPTDVIEKLPPVERARALIPHDLQQADVSTSGKMIAVASLLRMIKTTTTEKVVLVSNFTSTLDILEAHCKEERYRYERLDGKTAQNKRQDMVDRFNATPQSASFIFLLSSKSGGAGLNLIGASRLIMFDSDWNPSTDAQAMARIHRDGQKKKVFIYRFITTGTIDESILQRQITKLGLSNSVLNHDPDSEAGPTSNSFTPEELKALFTLRTQTGCYTHDLLGCDCLFEDINEDDDDDDYPLGLTRTSSTTTAVPDTLSDDSSTDEENAFFVSASNVRPEKTAKKARKAAKLKADKLAALREFKHVDCLNGGRNPAIEDPLLKSIIRKASKPTERGGRSSSTVAGSDSESSKGKGTGKMLVADSDDDSDEYESVIEEEEEEEPVVAAMDEDDEDGGDEYQEEDQYIASNSTSKRKSVLDRLDLSDIFSSEPEESRAQDAMNVDEALEESAKGKGKEIKGSGYSGGTDLRKMAESGEGGRICFLFERVAQVVLE